MKFRLVIAISLFGVALLISSAFLLRQPPQEAFLEKRAELVVRQIGHRLLQYSGDSTSRVLPVKRLSTNTFQLEFQNHFSFMPDTLVKIVRSNLALIDLPVGHLINVFACASKEVVYGFEIRPPGLKEIVPCLGRAQPKGCYIIQISFIDFQPSQNLNNYYPLVITGLIGLSLIAFTGGYYLKKKRKRDNTTVDGVSIGKYSFSPGRQLLIFNSETIELSHKEARLLSILAGRQNDLVSREELQKKVWEDDGVITGRSLDMFISKLRKKLKNDPGVEITNVHGKGYKLEIKPEL